MRRVIAIALTWAFLLTSAKAVRELVIVEELQPAQRVEGVVLHPSGAPIADMTVTDRTEDGCGTAFHQDGQQRTVSLFRTTRQACLLSPVRSSLVQPLAAQAEVSQERSSAWYYCEATHRGLNDDFLVRLLCRNVLAQTRINAHNLRSW